MKGQRRDVIHAHIYFQFIWYKMDKLLQDVL